VCAFPDYLAQASDIIKGIEYVGGLKKDLFVKKCVPDVNGKPCVWHHPAKTDVRDNFGCEVERISCAEDTAIMLVNCDSAHDLTLSSDYVVERAEEILSNCCMGHPGSDKCDEGADKTRSGGVWKDPTRPVYIDVRNVNGKGREC
jgi:hypothetical protein